MARAAFKYLFAFVFTIGLFVSADAQNQVIDLTQEIPIRKGQIRLDSLFGKISKHAHLVFTYDASKIKTSSLILVKSNNLTLLQIFSLLRNEASLDCKLVEDHVILFHAKPTQRSSTQSSNVIAHAKKGATKDERVTPVKKIQSDTLPPIIEKVVNAEPGAIEPEPVLTSTAKLTGEIDTVKKIQPAAQVPRDTIASKISNAAPARTLNVKENVKEPARSNFKMPDFTAKVGLSIDETSSFAANVHLGIPLIYGTASWQTNSNVSHYRLGAVASLPLRKNLNLILGWNTGKLQKTYVVDSVLLSQRYFLSVKSSLTKFSAFVEFPVSKKLYLQIGPQLNLLKTIYYRDSNPINLLNIGPNASDTYFTIKPPYSITKEVQPPSTYISNWIGLQVSIYYKINLSDL